MRHLIPLLLILSLAACAPALSPQEQAAADERDVLRLVQISLTDRLRPQLEASYRQQVVSVLPAEPLPSETAGRIVEEEISAALDAKMGALDKRLTSIFAARFSSEEIRQLLAFHESEVGRKSQKLSAALAAESGVAIQQWSQEFEQDLFERLTGRFSQEGVPF